ncbi:hypothetical protein DT019_17375 [Streptomyces sp. SDr-06]|uniref:ATP-grasp domain-containing protein n=1 Tax=Streptomyces sp. SDr-06 TaxID=2267702 RepID=UPI000DEAF1B2|nr:hypothetical protein [Streptomyces sp. SDr-06]RCH67395.1 hypothetical protein DT019_17375 [Streptomyces sp. SDr-06]
MSNVAVINYGPQLDYAAMLPELVDRLQVFSHHELKNTESFARYEYVENCEAVPYAELMIRRLARDEPFTHIVTDNEYDLERAARLRESLGIRGQSARSALSFRDKVVMKEVARRTVPTADFARLESIVDLTDFIAESGYPVVVKPVKQGGSRDISVLRGEDDLLAFSRTVWREDLMVEDFVDGQMYHVDAVIADGYRFVASSRYLRSCLDAFDVPPAGAYHLEVFHTPGDRLVLCEVASRVGGDRIPALTRATYGVDLHTASLRLSCDLPMDPPATTPPAEVHGSVSILPQGRPVNVPGRPPFPWVTHYEVNERIAPDAVTFYSASHLCFVIVRGADTAEVERRLLEAEAWLMARLDEQPAP